MGIAEIAESSRDYLVGFPWSQMSGKPADSIFTMEPGDVLQKKFKEAHDKLADLELTTDLEVLNANVLRARDGVENGLLEKEAIFMSIVQSNIDKRTAIVRDPSGAAASLDREVLRYFITKTWIKNLEAATALVYGVPQQGIASGVTSADAVVSAYDQVYAGFSALEFLYDLGLLDPIKKQPRIVPWMRTMTVSGTRIGEPVSTGIIIGTVVLTVAAMAILAWFILEWKRLDALGDVVDATCKKATESGDQKQIELCQKLGHELAQAGTKLPGLLGLDVGIGAAVVGAAGLLVWWFFQRRRLTG
jgi:hypothetical protein